MAGFYQCVPEHIPSQGPMLWRDNLRNDIQIAQCSDIVIVSPIGDGGRVNSIGVIFIISEVEPCVTLMLYCALRTHPDSPALAAPEAGHQYRQVSAGYHPLSHHP